MAVLVTSRPPIDTDRPADARDAGVRVSSVLDGRGQHHVAPDVAAAIDDVLAVRQ